MRRLVFTLIGIGTIIFSVLVSAIIIICLTGCKKEENPENKMHDATLTFYSQHSPFIVKYIDSGSWHTDTITGNTHSKSIKVAEYDFNKSQQIKSVASYPSDSLYIRADVDGKMVDRGFKGLYMKIEIDVSLSQAK